MSGLGWTSNRSNRQGSPSSRWRAEKSASRTSARRHDSNDTAVSLRRTGHLWVSVRCRGYLEVSTDMWGHRGCPERLSRCDHGSWGSWGIRGQVRLGTHGVSTGVWEAPGELGDGYVWAPRGIYGCLGVGPD